MAAYKVLGLPWSYQATDVEPDGLIDFLAASDSSLRGISVTMPHKVAALQAAQSCDLLSERTGSVNTLLCEYDTSGALTLRGFNTDVFGIVNAFADSGVHNTRHVAVIGGGATAASAVAAAAEMGAEHVSVIVRTPSKATYLESIGQECGVNVSVYTFEDISQITPVDVAISTLPGDALQSLNGLARSARATLLDAAYNPWPSARASEWSVAGGEVVSGLRMLAQQAFSQVRIFVGGSPFELLDREEAVKSAMFAAVGLESL